MKYRIISLIIFLAGTCASFQIMAEEPVTTRKERNTMLKANEAFNAKDYEKAIELYNMVLEINPLNDRAKYNLAVSMVKRADEIGGAGGNDNSVSPANPNATDSLSMGMMQNANKIFNDIFAGSTDGALRQRSVYNSGNIYFNSNELQKSIEQYKNALRLNPDDNNARHNLRVAQLRLQQQQDQNQEQNQDQDKKDQDQKDKEEQDKKDQEQQQDKKDQEQQQPQQPQQPQQQKPNYENILNAAQQNESKTRQRLEKKQVPVSPRYHNKPW